MPEKIIDVPGFGPTAFPDSMSDDEIVKAIQAQHPDLAPKAVAPAQPGFLESMGRMIKGDPYVNTAIGAAKDVGSTGYSLLQNATPIGRLLPPKPEALQPSNTPQKIGGALSTAAQFAVPSAMASKIPAVANAGLLGRSAIEAAISGGVSKARGETNPEAMRNALMTGGITGALGLAGKVAGPLGERIERGLLKPVKADLADVKGPPQFASQNLVKNLYKYDLGGTLQESYTKADALTKQLGGELRTALGSNPKADVDMYKVLGDTIQELKTSKASNFGTNSEINKAVKKMFDEIQSIDKSGTVNMADAQDMKQALGYMGAWQSGLRDADSTATETVANTMYTKLKTAIEASSGQSAEVQEINRKFSEIIPIKNALIRRIPVAARREPVSLKEFIALSTGNLKGIGLAAADRVMRSGTAANALVQAGKTPVASAAGAAPTLTGSMDALIRSLQEKR